MSDDSDGANSDKEEVYDEQLLEQLQNSIVDTDFVHDAPREACCFKFSVDSRLPSRLVSAMHELDLFKQTECLAITITNINRGIMYCGTAITEQNTRYALVDSYLRYRHETLHNLVMLSFGEEVSKTDESFRSRFGINSTRTPDKFIVVDKNVLIVETTAALSISKSYITKGKIEEGFQSKYEKEMRMLRDEGYNVDYVVLIFDMKNPANNSYLKDVMRISDFLEVEPDKDTLQKLSTCKNIYTNTAKDIIKAYSVEVTNLLSINVDLEPTIPECYKYLLVEGESELPTYRKTHVSTHLYNRITASWSILPYLLEKKDFSDTDKIVLQFDYTKNAFEFVLSDVGYSYKELSDILRNNDKASIVTNMKRKTAGLDMPPDRADIEFFDLVPCNHKPDTHPTPIEQTEHANTTFWEAGESLSDYGHKVNNRFYQTMKHNLEDKDYEKKLVDDLSTVYRSLDTMAEFIEFSARLNKLPFSANKLNESKLRSAVEVFNKEQFAANNQVSASSIKLHQKAPFLYPITDHTDTVRISIHKAPRKALSVLPILQVGGYTRIILNHISDPTFKWGSRPVELNEKQLIELKKLSQLNKEAFSLQLEYKNHHGLDRVPKLGAQPEFSNIKRELVKQNKAVKDCGANVRKELSIIKIPLKKNSRNKVLFEEEMKHFKKKKSQATYKGVGILEHESLLKTYECTKLFMKSPDVRFDKDGIYDPFVSDDVTLLKMLKTDHIKNYKEKYDYIRGTMLYSTCEFVSRFCHTLAYLSQTSFNGETITVDNLGYDNCIIMVKGGKKVFRTKKSKLYRILHPLPQSLKDWYCSPGFSQSGVFAEHNGVLYTLTPWQNLHETLINDGLTFLHRSMSFMLLCHEPEPALSFDKCYLNVMLALHARRKTEAMMHNLRYVSVNCISDASRVQEMLPTLAGFNYDFFQAYLRGSISKNFLSYSTFLLNYNDDERASKNYFKENGFRSLIGEAPIDNLEDLTLTIYSTFLMSKSPTTQSLEQVSNLRSMFDTHDLHSGQSVEDPEGQSLLDGYPEDEFEHEWDRLFASDFRYDTKYCVNLGKFASDYMSSILETGELQSEWVKIADQGWDEFANTKGLRGFKNGNFFNKKGYYIVYAKLLEEDTVYIDVMACLKSDMQDDEKRKVLNKLNRKYRDHMGAGNIDCLVFHVVDKTQRGGEREIYVMDLETKINQQIIEKYLHFLCKKVPNEAISIPSNRRLQHIHATVFEKFKEGNGVNYNLSLDCRKWAPRSVLNKFVDFIVGMSGSLPDSFVTHFINFFAKMFKKKVYTKKYIYDILMSNNSVKEQAQRILVKCDKNENAYYFVMSYSWVMGIFNYMSSFMHVMNQLHATHIIYHVSLKHDDIPVIMHMNAHSDDSCGKLQSQDDLSMRKSMMIYEYLLKKANHMLSDKKCNISRKYFEFLSVLYINNVLLSLMTKIMGSFSFHPTDKGYCGDINEAYSKCIEIISLGGTFEQAYLAMKISVHSIFRFYFNRDPTPADYKMPTQLLGVPDSHPILVLLTGSDSDVIRLVYKDRDKLKIFHHISNCIVSKDDEELELLNPINATPRITLSDPLQQHLESINAVSLPEDLKWILKNTKLKHTGMRLLRYGLQLYDKNFQASMIDETLTRRISRAFYYRSNSVIKVMDEFKTYKELKYCINCLLLTENMPEFDDVNRDLFDKIKLRLDEVRGKEESDVSLYELMNIEVFEMMENLDKLAYSDANLVLHNKTCKPIHINMQKTSLPTDSDFSPSNLTTWICFEDYRWLIPVGDDYANKANQVEIFLQRHGLTLKGMSPKWVYGLLERLKKRYVKEYFIYSNMPHNIRDVSNYRDFLQMIAHNSFRNKTIQGIVLPFGETVTQKLPALFRDVLTKREVRIIELIYLINSLLSSEESANVLANLVFNKSRVGLSSSDAQGLLEDVINEWEFKKENEPYIVPHAVNVLRKAKGERISSSILKKSYYYCFLQRQKLIGNLWLGSGLLYINTPDLRLELELKNQRIEKISADKQLHTFSQQEISYVNSVLMSAGFQKIEDHFENTEVSNWEKISLGYSTSGNMVIDKVRNLYSCIKRFNSLKYIRNPASEVDKQNLTLKGDLSYTFEDGDELRGYKQYRINVYKVDPTNIYETAQELLENEHNFSLLAGMSEEPKRYLKMIIGESSGATMSISMVDFLDLYRASVSCKIIQTLVMKEKLGAELRKPRKHLYPGQHGGLLAALLDYRQFDNDFKFDGDLTVTPEMMLIKSSQPDLFVSNLITNVKEKFNMLYNSDQRMFIKQQINMLWEVINSSEMNRRLLTLLTTWGYVGVMGSLEEMNITKSITNLERFKSYDKSNPFKALNYEGVKVLLGSVYSAAEKYNYFSQPLSDQLLICKNLPDMKKTIISYVHSYMLNTKKGVVRLLNNCPNFEIMKIHRTVSELFKDPSYVQEFNKELECNPLTAMIEFQESTVKDFTITIETMMDCIANDLKNPDAIYDNVKWINHENVVQPYIKTQTLLKDTKIGFGTIKAYHQGVISRDQRKRIVRHQLYKHKGKLHDINIVDGDYSDYRQPFNKNLWLRTRFTEDFYEEDEDFAEIAIELQSTEPDGESYEDMIEENYDKGYPKRVKVWDAQKRLVTAAHHYVKFYTLFDLKVNTSILDRIRPAAETILIYTDLYLEEIIESFSEYVSCFVNSNSTWYNKSLIDPDCCMFYLIDSSPIDQSLWEVVLDCKCVSLEKLNSVKQGTPCQLTRMASGIVQSVSRHSTLAEKMASLKSSSEYVEKEEEPPKEEEKRTDKTLLEKEIDRLRWAGFDADFIEQTTVKLAAYHERFSFSMEELILSFIKGKETTEMLKNVVRKEVNVIINKLEDFNKAVRIFEVADVFSVGRTQDSEQKNKSLKDNRLRAEIDSLAPGLMNKILSGRLTISNSTNNLFKKHLRSMRSWAKSANRGKEQKIFLIDLCYLILNDAYIDDNVNDDWIFESIQRKTLDYIVEDEDDDKEEDILEDYRGRVAPGKIYYGF